MEAPTITNYANPIYSSDDLDRIDLDIETAEYGWIPTTIQMSDSDEAPHIVAIKQWLTDNSESISAFVPETPAILDVQTISKLQCKRQAVQEGLWTSFKAILDSDAEVKENWDLAPYLHITDPDVIAMGMAMGKVGDDLQTFFNNAAQL